MGGIHPEPCSLVLAFENRVLMKTISYLLAIVVGGNLAWGQRQLREIPEASVEAEWAKFEVADGFEVNLFAADPLLAKPIQINFDAQGRLWVASSVTYPQIAPQGVPEDRIIIVEDVDGDGMADRSTLFADDLLIPNGVIPGDGGAYVAQASELLHLRDEDQDGRADVREVLLSGFGTQDTHHTLHGLTWGPDGWLYMLQGYYIASHVETLYGPRRLNGGGAWRYHPSTGRLEIYSRGLVNPWGIQFDRWGQTFQTDGAGGEGINYSFPGATFRASPGELRFLRGLNPGSPKLCGIEVLSGSHIPESYRGHLLANDFRANRMNRFRLEEDGSGFRSIKMDDLIRSTHVSFRPIDIAMGPDGAIYLADWYSPIIQHGEVSFRDERRDHVHGRVWRITAKDRALTPRVDFRQQTDGALLEFLKVESDYSRRQARRVLVERYRLLQDSGTRAALQQTLVRWRETLDRTEVDYWHHLLELMWLYQSLDWVQPSIVETLIMAPDHRVRAAAVRCVGEWQEHYAGGFDVLKQAVTDLHPRVRLEAVRALAAADSLEAASVLAMALDQDLDAGLDYAVWRGLRELSPHWLPELQSGQFDFNGQTEHLVYALRALESAEAVESLVTLAKADSSISNRTLNIWKIVSQVGTATQLNEVWSFLAKASIRATKKANLIQELIRSSRERGVSSAPKYEVLNALLKGRDKRGQLVAIEATGEFKVHALAEALRDLASSPRLTEELRSRLFWALGRLGGTLNEGMITTRIATLDNLNEESQLAAALAISNPKLAAIHASRLIRQAPEGAAHWLPLVRVLLSGHVGSEALADVATYFPLPKKAARMVLNEVGASGREFSRLRGALLKSANLGAVWSELSGEDSKNLAQVALAEGNAERGKTLYESETLLCTNCHALDGVESKVGPDLRSIGASAPVDYLLESLIRPNAAIKEGYQTLNVETIDGALISGVRTQETDESLILRGVNEEEIVIPIKEIKSRNKGRSLMPEGLVDSLSQQELLDLVKFLSLQGKNGS